MMGMLVALLAIEIGIVGVSGAAQTLFSQARCAVAQLADGRAGTTEGRGPCPCGEVCDDDAPDEDVVDRDVRDEDACDGCTRPDPDDPDDSDER